MRRLLAGASGLAALKWVALGGPVAVAFAAIGSALLGMAAFDSTGAHYDVMIVLGVTAIVLGFVEWALARRFREHEAIEKELYGALALQADSAVIGATEAVRNLKELRRELEDAAIKGRTLAGDVAVLDRRLAYIEERLSRSAGMVPRRPPDDK